MNFIIFSVLLISPLWAQPNYQSPQSVCQTECEIESWGQRLLETLVAEEDEDTVNLSLSELLRTRPEVAEAYYDEIFRILTNVELGFRPLSRVSEAEREARTASFARIFAAQFATYLSELCSGNYQLTIRSIYSTDTREIYIRREMNYAPVPDDAACLTEQTRTFGEDFVNHYHEHTRIIIHGDGSIFPVTTSDHYVIPLDVFVQFFKKWLDDDDLPPMSPCLRALYSRLRRNMLKIFAVGLGRSGQFLSETARRISYQENYNLIDDFFTGTLGAARNWMRGNVVVATNWQRHQDTGSMDARAQSMMDEGHWSTLENVFETLTDYNSRNDMDPVDRLMDGFAAFVSVKVLLESYPITQRGPDRMPRSVSKNDPDTWREFVLDGMKMSVKYREQGKESPSWQCNFDRALDDYNSMGPRDCNFCGQSFEDYLLKSSAKDWQRSDAWTRMKRKLELGDMYNGYWDDVSTVMESVLRNVGRKDVDYEKNEMEHLSSYGFGADEAEESLFLLASMSQFMDK